MHLIAAASPASPSNGRYPAPGDEGPAVRIRVGGVSASVHRADTVDAYGSQRARGTARSRNCKNRGTAMGAERDRVDGFGRLEDGFRQASDWYLWGPYVSERQWGTVREDYSADGEAWDYLPHDNARSRAYRWGEDGLAGFCDVEQRLCLGLALWNGRDPILKERAFGLTGAQANHGEDVKEYWWYLDAVPSHALEPVAVPLPAGVVPLRGPAGGERQARETGPRVRAARHRRIRP